MGMKNPSVGTKQKKQRCRQGVAASPIKNGGLEIGQEGLATG